MEATLLIAKDRRRSGTVSVDDPIVCVGPDRLMILLDSSAPPYIILPLSVSQLCTYVSHCKYCS